MEHTCPSSAPYSLSWRSSSDEGWCVECYASAAAVEEAEERGYGCFYCDRVECGFYLPDNAEGDEEDQAEEEDFHSEDEEENWLESLDDYEWDWYDDDDDNIEEL